MEKTIGNYAGQPNRDFPLDCETLAALAENQAMAEILGNICGDKTILLGCGLNAAGTSRSEGYVFLRTRDYPGGEVLRWTGGAVGGDMHVETEAVSVTADGYQYPSAYTLRRLVPGLGTETYIWDDFADIATNRELALRVAELEDELARTVGEPIGTIKMWPSAELPANYLMCDGGTIPSGDEYDELRRVLGKSTTPDLKGRFVVGYDPADGNNDSNQDTNYTRIGNAGGERKHTLTVAEMPSHSHTYNKVTDDHVNGGKLRGETNSFGLEDTQTTTVGGGQSHENRPPYYVLAYIIKAK